MRRLAKAAGITRPISPHSRRHAAITAALDTGCSRRDVQDYARHADPRQTRRHDRTHGALDRNPTCILATYVARHGRSLTAPPRVPAAPRLGPPALEGRGSRLWAGGHAAAAAH